MALADKIAKKLDSLEIERKNILDFAKEDLGISLLPAQIFIFKLFYSIPLSNDKRENCIPIGDRFNEKVLYQFSEVEFAEFLFKSNRLNVKDISIDNIFLEIVFVIGRRGTKTTMSSIVTLYTIYLILLLDNPHDYFGILEEDEIGVAIVSNSRDGADRQFRTITKMVFSSVFFKKHLVKDPSGGQLFLRSRRLISASMNKDVAKATSRGDILISTFAANPNVRGASNIVTISDEFAHFLDSDVSSKRNPLDKVVFEALTPSTSGFVYKDGRPAGKNFFISSPNGKKGMLYSKYQTAMKNKGIAKATSLVINVPSHWVNHKLAAASLISFFNESERSYEQEYEAKFVDKTGGWLSNIRHRVMNCINRNNMNLIEPGRPINSYFMGIDFGVGHDGSAFAVAHYEPFTPDNFEPLEGTKETKQNVIVVDYIGYILPEEGKLVTLENIYSELNKIMGHYIIEDGTYDQWSGGIFSQLLEEKGYRNLRKSPATQQSNSDQAKLFRQLIAEGRVIIPNKPDFIEELFRLNETVSREGLVKVEDTEVHDDQYDAVVRAIFLAFSHIDSNLKSYQVRSNSVLDSRPKQTNLIATKSSGTKFNSSSTNIRKPQVLRR